MILTLICGALVVGWTINAAVFQARGNLPMSLLNAALALAAMGVLVWRLA
jgi:hypothetical protein